MDRLAVEARVRDLLGRRQHLAGRTERGIGQAKDRAVRNRDHIQVGRTCRRREEVADPAPIRRPLRMRDNPNLWRHQHLRITAISGHDPQIHRPVRVRGVGEPFPIRRPGSPLLIRLLRRQLLRLSTFRRHRPIGDPPGAMGAEEDQFPVRRGRRIPKRPAVVVIEKVLVGADHPRVGAVAAHPHDLVIDPTLIEPGVDDVLTIGAERCVDLVVRVARQAMGAAVLNLQQIDVVDARPVGGDNDRGAIRRPCQRLDRRPQPRELPVRLAVRLPQPDLIRAALLRDVGDVPPIRRRREHRVRQMPNRPHPDREPRRWRPRTPGLSTDRARRPAPRRSRCPTHPATTAAPRSPESA